MSTITSNFYGAYTIGSSKRGNVNDSHDTPGPGSYNLSISNDYSQLIQGENLPKTRLAKSKRFKEIKENDLPSPGTYEVSQEIGENAPKFMFPKIGHDFKIVRKKDIIPFSIGPGSYEIRSSNQSNIRSQPCFSFGSKNEQEQTNTSLPGPGEYEINSGSISNRLSKKKRQKDESLEGYKLEPERGSDSSVNRTTSRFDSINESKFILGPGPGKYYPTLTKFSEGPRYSISKADRYPRRKIVPEFVSPAVASFEKEMQNDKSFTKGFSFSNKYYSNSALTQLDSPGPGYYDPQTSSRSFMIT